MKKSMSYAKSNLEICIVCEYAMSCVIYILGIEVQMYIFEYR